MTWSRLDDDIDGHPKVVQVGLDGFGLWVRSIVRSNRFLTDGKVDDGWIREVAGTHYEPLTEALVQAEMWLPNGSGFVVHDFLNHNPSRAQVLGRRAADAARKTNP